jgi:hypothetical protein
MIMRAASGPNAGDFEVYDISNNNTHWLAGHIGFELRCAERIFISLRKSKGSDLRTPVRTVARPRRRPAPRQSRHLALKLRRHARHGARVAGHAGRDVWISASGFCRAPGVVSV